MKIFICPKKDNNWMEPEVVNDLINNTESSSCLYLSPDGQINVYKWSTITTKILVSKVEEFMNQL